MVRPPKPYTEKTGPQFPNSYLFGNTPNFTTKLIIAIAVQLQYEILIAYGQAFVQFD